MKKAKIKPSAPKTTDANARDRIIEAATPLFAEKGLSGTTTRNIAQASGMNISLISYYFGGKEELYREILLRHAKQSFGKINVLFAFVKEEKLSPESFQLFLKSMIRSIIEEKTRNSNIERIITREVTSGLPHAREVFEIVMKEIGDGLAEVFIKAQADGVLRPGLHPHIILMHVVHCIEGYLSLHKCQTSMNKKIFKLPQNIDQLVEHILSVFLFGIVNKK